MATVKIKNLDAAAKKINKDVEGFLTESNTQEKIAKKLQDEYRKNIREGYDVKSESFKALEDKTIKHRAYLKSAGNKTSKSYSLMRSNLTFSGDLVQKIFIKFSSFKKGKAIFEIEFRGVHKAYKTKSGQSKAKPSTILDIANGLLDKDFDLFGFPERKVPDVSKRVAALFRAYLRRK